MRYLALSVFLAGNILAQLQSSAIFDDFSLGNRAHTGSSGYTAGGVPLCPGGLNTTNVIWNLSCGGTSGSFPWQTLTFASGKMSDNHSRPNTEPTLLITNLVAGVGGSIILTAPHHGYTASTFGISVPSVHVTGVTTCTGPGNDCGSTGFWEAGDITYAATSGMSGSITFNLTAQPFVNGDTVWLSNCIENPTMNQQRYTVSAQATNSFGLTGFTGTLCGAEAQVTDDMRIRLLNTTFVGSYGSQSGTVTRVASGFGLITQMAGHSTGTTADFVLAGNMLPGQTWDPTFNRFRWDMLCDYSVTFNSGTAGTVGANAYNLGTYVKPNITEENGLQGPHFYHFFAGNQYANRTIHFEANRRVQHSTAIGLSVLDVMEDFSFQSPPMINTPVHYWDGLVEFYITYGPFGDVRWINGGTCSLFNFTVAKVANESDTHVANIQYTYNGSAYEMAWNQPAVVPGGTLYDIRYSTSQSLHTLGFANGTSGGTAQGSSSTGAGDVPWTSSPMAEATNIWIGIRPHMVIQGVTGSGVSPIIVTPYGGHDLQTGNTITTASVPNVTNGTYTITRIAPLKWTGPDNTWTQVAVSGGVGTATVNSTAGLHAGMVLFITQTGFQTTLDTDPQINRSVVQSVTSGTTFTFNTGLADGTYAIPQTACTNSSACPLMATFPAMSLNGTTGSGSPVTTGTGTATPADSTVGFYEVQIPAQSAPSGTGGRVSGGPRKRGGPVVRQ